MSPLSPLEYLLQVGCTPPDGVISIPFIQSSTTVILLDQGFSIRHDFARAYLTMSGDICSCHDCRGY